MLLLALQQGTGVVSIGRVFDAQENAQAVDAKHTDTFRSDALGLLAAATGK